MGQIHELNTESNVGVGLDFVTDNGESTGKVGFAALAGGVLEKYEETELAGKRRSVKRAIDDLAQQVDDAVEEIDKVLPNEAVNLLVSILRAGVYTSDQHSSIADLENLLARTKDDIIQAGSTLTIYGLALTPTQDGSVLVIG